MEKGIENVLKNMVIQIMIIMKGWGLGVRDRLVNSRAYHIDLDIIVRLISIL